MQKEARRSLLSAFAVAFIDNFGYSFVFILFAPLILNPSYGFFPGQMAEGTKNILLGVLIGAFPLLTFFGAPFWGDYADRYGRKKALVLTLLGTVFGHVLSALAIFSESYLFLLLARAIAGFFSGNISICLATASDLSPTPGIKARNFGVIGVVMGIGWILAMLIGGYLSDPRLFAFSSPSLPFGIAAVITFLGYLVVKVWFTETHIEREPAHFDLIKSIHEIKSALHYREIRPFLLVGFFWTLGWFFTFQWFSPISLERYSVTQEMTSLYLVFLGMGWVLGGVALNPLLVKKFSSRFLSLITIFLTGLLIFITSWTEVYFVFSVIYCFSAVAAPISYSNVLNLVSMSAPEKIQGKAMGFTQSFQALGGVIVPLLGGVLAKWDIGSIFPIAAGFLFLSFIILLTSKIKHKAKVID